MKKFVEFFAGVGLVREGLNKSEWKCVWANDISPDKKDTYTENFGNNDFWLGDIWDMVERSEVIPDDAFLYTASFPCTDLSVAGNQAGLAGKQSGTLDAFIEILRNKKNSGTAPKVVLLENVRGFLTSHKGEDVKQTVKYFSELDYFVDIVELDAIDFSAQSRPRVFLIAVQEGLALQTMNIKESAELFDEWWLDFERNPTLRSKKIKDIILSSENLNWGLLDLCSPVKADINLIDIVETDIPDDSKLWWNEDRKKHLYEQMSKNHQIILQTMMKGSDFSYGTVYRRMRKNKSMAELRTDGFAGCLRTPRGGSSKQIVIRAGNGEWNVRLLTPREYARLQGVRDTFILPQNANKGYFAMGDAVCVPVIEFIAENVFDKLYEVHLKTDRSSPKS
nr:DNA (cytosine-5-)-methyltransferase [uncultured Psychrobacter sp.]